MLQRAGQGLCRCLTCVVAVFAVICCTAVLIIETEAENRLNLPGSSIFLVNLRDAGRAESLGATVAAGLLNRHLQRPAVITKLTPTDYKWISDLQLDSELSDAAWVDASPTDLIAYTVAVGAAKSVITYSPKESWSIANVVTLAGLEAAIPIPSYSLSASSENITSLVSEADFEVTYAESKFLRFWKRLISKPSSVTYQLHTRREQSVGTHAQPYFGALGLPLHESVAGRWRDELDATLWSFSHLHPRCSSTQDTIVIQRPELLGQGFLADYIVSHRLFAFFLPTMCVPGPQQALFQNIVESAYSNGQQLKVMGYSIENEVVADCSIHHTEISLVSDWCPNLSFYSRMKQVHGPWTQASFPPAPLYDPSHTYVAVINSDGDNMQMENNGNRERMEERVAICSSTGSICPPIAWTVSNQLVKYAPFLLQWYYRQAQKTGRDSFLMGPSGWGFTHPAAYDPKSSLLTEFVVKTVDAAEELGMSSYVHWDIDGNDLSQAHRGLWNASAQADSSDKVEILRPSRRSLSKSAVAHTSDLLGTEADSLEKNATKAAPDSSNSLARLAYLRQYDGTAIDTVFAPGEYNIPSWIGNVAGIHEQFRWGKELATKDAVKMADNLPRGTIGYIYKIFEVELQQLELFAAQVAPHVHILDHRQMHDVALQRKFYEQKLSSI